jgi:hypothetical protein
LSRLLAFSLLAFALLLAGCDSSSDGDSVTGTYSLIRIEGETLPYEVTPPIPNPDRCPTGDNLALAVISDGELILREDNTWRNSITTRTYCAASDRTISEEAAENSGSYSVSGDLIEFSGEDETGTSRIDGDRIVSTGDNPEVYEKD